MNPLPSTDFDSSLVELLREDPYPVYDRLRELARVLWSPSPGLWVVTGHREAAAVLTDPTSSVQEDTVEDGANRSILDLDPPDHTRLRALVQRAFTPRVVAALAPKIQRIVDDCCDAALERGGLDLMDDLASPLPVTVIAELLGVPPEDRAVFRGWSDDLIAHLEPIRTEEEQRRADTASKELRHYLASIIERRRREPGEDLLSKLIEVEEQGESLTTQELITMAVLLLVAGHETTVNLIGNGIWALLQHPDQWRRLQEHPDLIETAVEELLRYDSPVQMTSRTPKRDVELGGQLISARQVVVLFLGAANRDPEEFEYPDQLDIGRHPNHHLSFSRGIHFCLGAPLARLEGRIAIGTVARRLPGLHSDGEARRRSYVNLRGFVTMPLAT